MVAWLAKWDAALFEVEVFIATWQGEILAALLFVTLGTAVVRFCWKRREWFIIREGETRDD